MSKYDDTAWWDSQFRAHWNTDAPLTPLDGEYDLNFRVGDAAVLKIMRAGCDPAFVEMQVAALKHLVGGQGACLVPTIVTTHDGRAMARLNDVDGQDRLAWMISAIPGKPYALIRPQTLQLIEDVGRALGMLDVKLSDFDHPQLDREIKWNLCDPLWSRKHLALIEDREKNAALSSILDRFESACVPELAGLPMQAIHNDLNDYNIFCQTQADGSQDLTGLIDFGDMIRAPAVCDLAIAGAYIVLDQRRPLEALATLVQGYCTQRRLSEAEVRLIWPLVLTRLAVSALNAANMQRHNPDDPYVMISQEPIDRFLALLPDICDPFVLARLRMAAGYEPIATALNVSTWLKKNTDRVAPIFKTDLKDAYILDLSVTGGDAPQNPVRLNCDELTRLIDNRMRDGRIALGRYGEPRLIYTAPCFFSGDHPATDRRTVHLGIDVFLPAGTVVHAPLDGTVHSVDVCSENLGYGGVLVLRHETDCQLPFYSLYGHLAHEVVTRHAVGDDVRSGDEIALLGSQTENGGWAPHIHVQLGLFELPGPSWPGVADPDEWHVWRYLCPDPSALLGFSPDQATAPELDIERLKQRRATQTTANLKLSYDMPVTVLRGWKSYLFDNHGRPYLDAYNNVPHVGHAHPRVTEAVTRQMRLVNTNTRYLQPVHNAYAEALTEKLPDPLNVCFLLSSGSEANEVALRLARAFTGVKDTIVMAHGYHGHTCAAIDISDYKFSGPGGDGAPDWVHVVPNPDTYRGRWGVEDTGAGGKYAASVAAVVTRLARSGKRPAAFIAETFPSVGGQIVPPEGYLKAVYTHVRKAGGLCIADEVQTGLGRLGTFAWGFEQQNVVPDIVVLGKPIGNGYPLAAVITTREIADAFANGMEFFSTFGGSSVSCAAGHEVLRILDDEHLAENAAVVGAHILHGLREHQKVTSAIGDVRGMGLFLGVEMIDPDGGHSPRKASYVVNRLREHRVLIGSDGPKDNILKIRPPLCFSRADVDYFLDVIGAIFAEDVIQQI